MHLDAVFPQEGSARLARPRYTIDEENFLVGKNWYATKWWRTIHTTHLKGERPLWEGFGRILLPQGAGVKENRKPIQ